MENQPLRGSSAESNHTHKYEADKEKSCGENCACIKHVRGNLLLVLTVVGILLGIVVGFAIRPYNLSPDAVMWLGLPGEIFMRLLKMLILPLIICSVISGTASLNPKSNGKISVLAFLFCLITNGIACLLALIFTLIIRPGRFMTTDDSSTTKTQMLQTQDIFADLLRNLIPDNIVEACFSQDQTQYKEVEAAAKDVIANSTDGNDTVTQLVAFSKSLGKTSGANILGLIVVCLLIGIALNKSQGKGRYFLYFFTSATEVVLVLLRWLLWYTPFGVFSLIAVALVGIEDLGSTFTQLGLFVITVFVGVATHQIVVMPLILFLLTRRNPFRFILSVSKAWMLAFAATSTAIAIPEMLHSCEVTNKIDKRVSRFVIPFCVTMNADGSAIYITAAALFVATVTGNPPDVSTTVIVVALTTVAALAVPSVPSASIVTLVVILSSINIPAEAIGFLFTVEWFLDRIRSTSNVVSHTMCTAVVYRFCKADLPPDDQQADQQAMLDLAKSIGSKDGVVPLNIVVT